MEMSKHSQLIQDFFKLIEAPAYNYSKSSFYVDIVTSTFDSNDKLLEFINENPNALTERIKRNKFVFDYFYDRYVTYYSLNNNPEYWRTALISAIKLLSKSDHPTDIKLNKQYIHSLQSNHMNYDELFDFMLNTEFEVEDPEFITYSVIARGELAKLKIIEKNNNFNITDYKGTIAIALYYGRIAVIKHLVENTKLELANYGNIINFEFMDISNYLYYDATKSKTNLSNQKVINSVHNMTRSLNYIIDKLKENNIDVVIDSETVHIWCERARQSSYDWEDVYIPDIWKILRVHVNREISLKEDYKEYNEIIFGREWSRRELIIDQYLELQTRYEELMDRYELLEELYSTAVNS